MNKDEGKCELCPLGQYQNATAQTSCNRCEPTYNTITTGSTSPEDCKSNMIVFWEINTVEIQRLVSFS